MAREKLTKRLHVLVGEEQRARLEVEADARGWTLSQYIREAALEKASVDSEVRRMVALRRSGP